MALKSVIPELPVADVDRSAAFYRDVLGFQFATRLQDEEGADWACLKSGSVRLYLHRSAAAADPATAPLRAAIRLWFRPQNLEEVRDSLLARGHRPSELVRTSYGTRECSLTDPDGYSICLQEFMADLSEAPPD